MDIEDTFRFFDERWAEREKQPEDLNDYFKLATSKTTVDGLWIELGVASGRSCNLIAPYAKSRDKKLFCCDTFHGLPEDWREFGKKKWKKGHFSTQGKPPSKKHDNIVWVIGCFNETLPKLIKDNPEPVAFLHIHWTKNTDSDVSGQWVRRAIDYTVYDGKSQDINITGSQIELNDQYLDSGSTNRIVYRTSNVRLEGIQPGYYLGPRIRALTSTSGTTLVNPNLVSADMLLDVKINTGSLINY